MNDVDEERPPWDDPDQWIDTPEIDPEDFRVDDEVDSVPFDLNEIVARYEAGEDVSAFVPDDVKKKIMFEVIANEAHPPLPRSDDCLDDAFRWLRKAESHYNRLNHLALENHGHLKAGVLAAQIASVHANLFMIMDNEETGR